MLYLVGDPINPNSAKYFFANSSKRVVSSQWAFTVKSAIRQYKIALDSHDGMHHSVLKWIDSGCLSHSGYLLVAIFESDDLTQDFEAGITNFRENHPEYFL